MVHILGDGNNAGTRPLAWFTPARATEMLPLIRQIVTDLVSLDQAIRSQQEQLRGIEKIEPIGDQADYADELADMRESLESDRQRFERCLEELGALGVEPHRPIDGGVDFPAMLHRRPVRLCWSPGDSVVSHWHEVGQTPQQRRPLDPGSFPTASRKLPPR